MRVFLSFVLIVSSFSSLLFNFSAAIMVGHNISSDSNGNRAFATFSKAYAQRAIRVHTPK
jgi:hypothetical protein